MTTWLKLKTSNRGAIYAPSRKKDPMNTNTIKNNRAVRPVVTVLILLAVMLLSACATTTASREDVIKERAQARWDALLSRDYASAYALHSPGYRSAATVVDFEISMRTRRIRYTSAEYLEQNCVENTCTVRFRVGYQVNSPVPGVNVWNGFDVITDQWVKVDGEWWYLPDKS
jgi:hypothetical protein